MWLRFSKYKHRILAGKKRLVASRTIAYSIIVL